jgi:hypothetical protein
MDERAQPIPFREGQPLRPYQSVVGSERQRRYHDAAEVPDHLFGDRVDLSILANDTVLATNYLRGDGAEAGHVGQRMMQHSPIFLGEELSAQGCVSDIRQAARGTFVTFAFDFVRSDGTIPLKAELMTFQDGKTKARDEEHEPGDDDTLDRDNLEAVCAKQLTSRMVADYVFEFPGYLANLEPQVTLSTGLRAPVAQGMMSFTWMMEAIARKGLFDSVDISATFRRAIFWDDMLQLFWRGDRDLLMAKSDGLICATSRVIVPGY